MAFQAGCDMENPPATYQGLTEYVRSGAVSEKDIDRSLRNVLTVRFRLGMFDPPEMVPYTRLPYSLVGCEKHTNLALQTARESIVLLKTPKISCRSRRVNTGKLQSLVLSANCGIFSAAITSRVIRSSPASTV